jgi:hypothetical protein
MKPPVTLEPSLGERLLLTTGAAKLPDKKDLKEAGKVWRELCTSLEEAMKLENPGHFYAFRVSDNYWEKLRRYDPDYSELIELSEGGASFQSLQLNAKEELEGLRRKTTITNVLGFQLIDVEPHGIEERTALRLADTVEHPDRLIRDFAAAALCYEQVQLFADVYPETYSGLIQVAQLTMAKLWPVDARGYLAKTAPPLWVQDALTVLFQEPLEVGVKVEAAKEKPLSSQRKTGGKALLNIDSRKGPADIG